ncbi:MAG TPA: response regulator [Polyangiaceae bacterium]|nr:response regulator [Polyangiaceae bacterium]
MSKRLLLVEDDATLARALARLLRRRKADVFLAGSCEEARAAEGTFSLGVFDVDLPDGDGLSLAAELQTRGVVRRIVFYSGTTDPKTREQARALGIFVEKARGFPDLEAAIFAALAKERTLVAGGDPIQSHESTSPPPSGVRGPPTPRR